jgi:hypothetical protein
MAHQHEPKSLLTKGKKKQLHRSGFATEILGSGQQRQSSRHQAPGCLKRRYLTQQPFLV